MAKKENMKKPETDEIATIEKDIYQGYIGKVMLNPDKTLKSESGGKGVEIYEDLLRDPEIRQAMQTRRLAVTGREWQVIPGSDDGRDQDIADYVEKVLLNCNYDVGRRQLLAAIVIGFKTSEIMWEYSEGSVWINEFRGRESRRFTFGTDHSLRLLTLHNMIEGELLPEKKFQLFSWGSENASPFGYGLGASLYWLDWFGRNAMKFWLVFADKFGSPTAVGKYPAGTPTDKQQALLAACDTIQQESSITIPDTMVIDLLEAARQGSINTYETLCKYLDKKKTKLILGQTLTSDVGDKGSYAASKTHDEVRMDIVKADADELCTAMNKQVIKWLVDYNFPGVKNYPQVWIRTEDEKDLKPLAERDKTLVKDIGLPVTKKYFYDTYGIPEPEKDEELVQIPSSNTHPIKGAPAQEFAEPSADPEQQAIDNLGESITPDKLQGQLNGVLKPVIDLINDGESFEDIQEMLVETFPDMDTQAIEDMLARAIFISEAWGRLNA